MGDWRISGATAVEYQELSKAVRIHTESGNKTKLGPG